MKRKVYCIIKIIVIILLIKIAAGLCDGILYQYKVMKQINSSQSEKVTATIDFIGLPDGQPFVSFSDSDNVLHTDVPLSNVKICGELEKVEKHYGDKLELIYNEELDKAYSESHNREKVGLLSGFLIADIFTIVLVVFKYIKKIKTKSQHD